MVWLVIWSDWVVLMEMMMAADGRIVQLTFLVGGFMALVMYRPALAWVVMVVLAMKDLLVWWQFGCFV